MMASSYAYEDDQDDLEMIFEYESESDSDDDNDAGEVGEVSGDGDNVEEEEAGIGPWQYEPMPHGQPHEPGENVGDAQPPADPARLLGPDNW